LSAKNRIFYLLRWWRTNNRSRFERNFEG